MRNLISVISESLIVKLELLSQKKHSKFDFKFSNCRLLEYAALIQYILYEMNFDYNETDIVSRYNNLVKHSS